MTDIRDRLVKRIADTDEWGDLISQIYIEVEEPHSERLILMLEAVVTAGADAVLDELGWNTAPILDLSAIHEGLTYATPLFDSDEPVPSDGTYRLILEEKSK